MELQYEALDRDSSEIRLITIPPGQTTDDIRFRLWHAPLQKPVLQASTRLGLEQLQKTLPLGWTVAETHQYKYSYIFEHDDTENTQWIHPDPNCNPSLWAPALESPPADFEPQFESLSYTWGSGKPAETAFVEYSGTETSRTSNTWILPLGQNLAQALRHLRRTDADRTLWVDAICINQKDIPEREYQVRKMSLLYQLARRVVVWLGPQSSDSDIAVSSLQYIGSQIEIGRNRARFRAPGAIEAEWFRATTPLSLTKKAWTAVDNLFQRPWFERLWIWQEIQLANSNAIVVCGNHEMLWQQLRKAIICLLTKQQLPTQQLRTRLGDIDPLTIERYSGSFNLLINISRMRKCFDPRDKIYGMLSICGVKLGSKIETSYKKDVKDVYKDVFLQYANQVERLDLLSGCDSALQLEDSPSWVPNWTIPRETWPLYGFSFASGISKSSLRFQAPDILEVEGVRFARIERVTERAPLESPGTLDMVRTWEMPDLQTGIYVAGGSLLDAYCTTIRAGYFDERWPTVKAPSLEEWKDQYLNRISPRRTDQSNEDCELDADIDWMLKMVRGRTFMTMEEGYIGIGPPEATSGETSCDLF